eukprot:maker-scaffold_11-snap-gene-9.46-mRNA-1 protein AED:0.32 eAED:0.33 QI:0/0/0.5/1/0/0/2/421/61
MSVSDPVLFREESLDVFKWIYVNYSLALMSSHSHEDCNGECSISVADGFRLMVFSFRNILY